MFSDNWFMEGLILGILLGILFCGCTNLFEDDKKEDEWD